MVAPNNLGQQVALQMGWNGAGQGAGGHTSWVNSLNPQQRAAYDRAVGGNATATPTSSMPLLVEPLHQWEQQGLTEQAGGADTSKMESILADLRSRLSGGIDTASGYTSNGVSAVTPEEIAARQNPYAENLKNKLSTDAEKIRATITAGQGTRGARSFGDTSTGVQNASLNDSILQGYGTIDYNTWQDALNQINTEKDRYLTGARSAIDGAGTATNGGNTAFNLAKTLSDTGITNSALKTEAGRYVRDYNQGVDDRIANDITAEQQDPLAKLENALRLLTGNFISGTNSSQTGGMANPLTRIGGAGVATADTLTKLFPKTFG